MYLGLIGPSGGYYVAFQRAPFDYCTGVDESEQGYLKKKHVSLSLVSVITRIQSYAVF